MATMDIVMRDWGLPSSNIFAGGSIGGSGLFDENMRIRPEAQAASIARGKKGIRVLPSGAGSKQELRYLREQAEREGYDWTEAPRPIKLITDSKGTKRYIDPKTGQSVGTFMWLGGPADPVRGEKEEPVPTPEPEPKKKKNKPTEPAPEGYVRNKYGYFEPKEWYTEDGRKMTEQEYRESKKRKQAPPETQPRPIDAPFSLFSSYSPLLQNPSLNFPYL